MPRRSRLTALIAAVGLIPLGFSGMAAATTHAPARSLAGTGTRLTAAQVSHLTAHATDRSIIIFRNQLASLPVRGATAQPRVTAADAAQAPVLAELRALHASHVQGFHIINAIAATISPAEAQRLRANPAVRAVVPDSLQHLAPALKDGGAGPAAPKPGRAPQAPAQAAAARHAAQRLCPASPAKPLIEPEARSLMNVAAAQQLVDGTGIKVAVLADGFDPDNPELIRRNGQHVVFDYQDFSGQGQDGPSLAFASFLGTGLIAAQGNKVYDLSKYVNPAHPLPTGCNIKIEGIAPGASLAEENWGGDDTAVFNSQILQSVQRVVMVDHVNVIDEPFGGSQVPNTENDPVALADQAAVAAGVVVVASTGDNGSTANDIDSPGGVPGVIGVGATTAFQSYRQTDDYGPGPAGGWENNNISALSTNAINEFNPRTFDVVAPGDRLWTLCSTDTARFFSCTDPDNGSSPGIAGVASTSVSASAVSAVAALVMQAYAKTHHGVMPPAPLVEKIIVSTATDLGAPADHQGAGLVNALKAVQLAESAGRRRPHGHTLLVDQTGLNATLNAGQHHTFRVRVTNEGRAARTVTPVVSGRPVPRSSDTGKVTLSASSPTQVDGAGATDPYEVHTFTVRPGAGYLNGDISWNAQQTGGAAFETLFDPRDNLAAYSVLGSEQSGYGHVEVRRPMAGRWTAVIHTTGSAPYFGPVRYSYRTEDFRTAGSVSPASRKLAPGQAGTFHVRVTAGQPGDQALRLHLGTGSRTDGAIPVVLRALVPVTHRGGSFTGTLTGDGSPGFGTTAGGGQLVTYQFRVPGGRPSLNVGVKLAKPGYVLQGSLIAPSGEPLDLQSTANDSNSGAGQTLQFFRRTPAPGLWTVSLITTGPTAGTSLSTPFTGTISFSPPKVTSSGLPDSAATVLPAGQPVTAKVTVTNNGNIAKDYFADPRLNRLAPMTLLGTTEVGGTRYTEPVLSVPEPITAAVNPHWLVPADTRRLVATAHGTRPLSFDINSDDNDPEELGVSSGNDSVATHAEPELAPGQEWAAPEPVCPCPAPVSGTTSLSAVATANAFDGAVTASTGDVWAQTVSASAPYTPMTLKPGQSGTIKLTITPSAPKGTVVRGFIAVDTYNQGTSSGDELVNIRYTYKVG
jgi:hypothetical protein